MLNHKIKYAVLLLAVSAAYPLRASTAYGYSANNVFVGFDNGTVVNPLTSLASNTSSFSGAGTATHSGPTDPTQTKAGPGPYPGENSFGPQGQVGQFGYSRADTEINSATVDDLAGANVAEAYLTNPGAASDLAYDQFQFGLTPTVANQPISITIFANPSMQVTTTGDGSAQANLEFVVNIYNHATNALLLRWFPDGDPLHDTTLNAGSIFGVEDPYSLNAGLSCSGNCSMTYDPGSPFNLNEWTLSYEGATPGLQYDVSVTWVESVNVAIPEPASLGLTGAALILLGMAFKKGSPAYGRIFISRLLCGLAPLRAMSLFSPRVL
jgi:hypothetical protein